MGHFILELQPWASTTEEASRPLDSLYNVVVATTQRQAKVIPRLQETLRANPNLLQLPLADALLRCLQLWADASKRTLVNGRAFEGWLPQTHLRELLHVQATFASLPKYCHNVNYSVTLNSLPVWRNAREAWKRLAIQSQPLNQAAASAEQIQEALALTNDKDLRAFLMLLWISCGRKGDIAQLKKGNIKLEPNGAVTFFIEQGKGVLANQAKYRVPSHCPRIWFQELQEFINRQRAARSFLFRRSLAKSNEAINCLREVDPNLSCRAVRRGSLQTMAAAKVEEETLRILSGHKSIQTLRRYLDFDRINPIRHGLGHAAGRHLTESLDNPSEEDEEEQEEEEEL